MRQKQTHRQTEQTCDCQRGGTGGDLGLEGQDVIERVGQQGPTVPHRDPYPAFQNKPQRKRI